MLQFVLPTEVKVLDTRRHTDRGDCCIKYFIKPLCNICTITFFISYNNVFFLLVKYWQEFD